VIRYHILHNDNKTPRGAFKFNCIPEALKDVVARIVYGITSAIGSTWVFSNSQFPMKQGNIANIFM